MAPNRILEEDDLDSPVSPERPDLRAGVRKVLAALSRHRVLVGSVGIAVVAIVAVLAWRWPARGESTPVAPSAGVNATSAPERQLEITVLGVHDVVAAAVPTAPPQPPVAVPLPAAAPASAESPPATVPTPSRANPAPRSAPSRAQSSSAAKASPLPVAAAKSVPAAQESRVEIAPAKPQPKPDGPPMEANPYVYK